MSNFEQCEKVAGSRYILAGILMKRVNEMIKGSPINRNLKGRLKIRDNDDLAKSSYPKAAMEEFEKGKIEWSHSSKPIVELKGEPSDIVFDGRA